MVLGGWVGAAGNVSRQKVPSPAGAGPIVALAVITTLITRAGRAEHRVAAVERRLGVVLSRSGSAHPRGDVQQRRRGVLLGLTAARECASMKPRFTKPIVAGMGPTQRPRCASP